MKITPLVICGLVFCGVLACGAASPSPSPLEKTALPPGPWVKRMPDFSAWIIQFAYSDDKRAAKRKPAVASSTPALHGKGELSENLLPRQISVTRTQPTYHVAVTDVAGRPLDLWFVNGDSFLITPDLNTPHLPGTNAEGVAKVPAVLDYSHSDFPDVEWVSAATYVGAQQEGGVGCLVFRQSEKGPSVWIDAKTGFPVKWQSEGEIRTFVYLDAPKEGIVLPPAVVEAAKQIHRMDEISSHRPPRGS